MTNIKRKSHFRLFFFSIIINNDNKADKKVAKEKVIFFCTNCGHESPKWEGKCISCGSWNTYSEEKRVKKQKQTASDHNWNGNQSEKAIAIQDVSFLSTSRIITSDNELNNVLGGGIVEGSLILMGGEPGIGKSTLSLQTALNLDRPVAYISGEESAAQIKLRADRIGIRNEACYIIGEINVEKGLKEARKIKPALIIIDSIQTMFSPNLESSAGSVSQIRECTALVQQFAKQLNIPVIIIGHITKEGTIAGPKLLEHIVDVVLQFEGDHHYSYRILRASKNRFGSTDEVGIYKMNQKGLKAVENPSEMLLRQSDEALSGSAIAATLEGIRPLLVEVQALVSPAVYGNPQRSATGFDLRRLNMLLAVLEKRCGIAFGNQDVFLNIAGGLKISDPAMDLAIIAALISSHQNISIHSKIAFAGEVGLSGEIRSVNRIENRILESNRLGFEQVFIPQRSDFNRSENMTISINQLSKVDDLLRMVFA